MGLVLVVWMWMGVSLIWRTLFVGSVGSPEKKRHLGPVGGVNCLWLRTAREKTRKLTIKHAATAHTVTVTPFWYSNCQLALNLQVIPV